jgi:hypothetical protein
MSTTVAVSQYNKSICTGYAAAERVLDVAGYIPGVNFFSSAVRAGVALTQITHGVALFILAGFSHLLATVSNQPDQFHPFVAKDCLYLFKNGGLNLMRASIEMTELPGALICLIYDCAKSNLNRSALGETYGKNVTNVEIHRPFIAQLIA